MIAFNEEKLIARSLRSARGLVDEMVIGIDNRTTDATYQIAKAHGARVFDFEWRDDFAYARNLTLEAAHGEWILILDADEHLLLAGVHSIDFIANHPDPLRTTDGGQATGYRLSIANTKLGGTPIGVPHHTSGRLFKRSSDNRFVGLVHEELLSVSDRSRTRWAKLGQGPHITHVGYDPALSAERGKNERNMRLLTRRLALCPDDVMTHIYLARQHNNDCQPALSAQYARRALELLARTEWQRDREFQDLVFEMQWLVHKGDQLAA
jgi:hypothetical protein